MLLLESIFTSVFPNPSTFCCAPSPAVHPSVLPVSLKPRPLPKLHFSFLFVSVWVSAPRGGGNSASRLPFFTPQVVPQMLLFQICSEMLLLVLLVLLETEAGRHRGWESLPASPLIAVEENSSFFDGVCACVFKGEKERHDRVQQISRTHQHWR